MSSAKIKEIAVLSGKGGTGKTSLVGALAAIIPDKILVDCDVDAPDLHLLLDPQIRKTERFMGGRKAVIRAENCTACGLCREVCNFQAISEDYRVDPFSCEGCGVCVHFCPVQAIDFPLAECASGLSPLPVLGLWCMPSWGWPRKIQACWCPSSGNRPGIWPRSRGGR